MKEVYFDNSDEFFMVDDEFYDTIIKYRWRNKQGYPVVMNKGDLYLEHVYYLILNKRLNYQIDHINMNTLDNRLINLRYVTGSQNMMNRLKFKTKNPSSKYKGVRFLKNNKFYQVRITKDRKTILLGHFEDEIISANVYNHYCKFLHGEYGKLNDVKYIELSECLKYRIGKGGIINE